MFARPSWSGNHGFIFVDNVASRLRTIVFIDSSNFYHSFKEQYRVSLGIDGFEQLFGLFGKKFDLQQIRFYDAIKDRTKDPDGYAGQQRFHAQLAKLSSKLVIRSTKLRYLVNIDKQKVLYAAQQTGIVDNCKNLIWQLLVNLKLIKVTKEKGIDVLLVVDAIEAARSQKPDCIILVTGDADFVPAVNLLKSLKVKTINLHAYAGSSNELRTACDNHALITLESDGKPAINWYE